MCHHRETKIWHQENDNHTHKHTHTRTRTHARTHARTQGDIEKEGERNQNSLPQRVELSKGAKIRNRCNQVPHLTQNIIGKVTNSQLYTTNERQEVSPFPAGDHKAHINRCVQRHSKHKSSK